MPLVIKTRRQARATHGHPGVVYLNCRLSTAKCHSSPPPHTQRSTVSREGCQLWSVIPPHPPKNGSPKNCVLLMYIIIVNCMICLSSPVFHRLTDNHINMWWSHFEANLERTHLTGECIWVFQAGLMYRLANKSNCISNVIGILFWKCYVKVLLLFHEIHIILNLSKSSR